MKLFQLCCFQISISAGIKNEVGFIVRLFSFGVDFLFVCFGGVGGGFCLFGVFNQTVGIILQCLKAHTLSIAMITSGGI